MKPTECRGWLVPVRVLLILTVVALGVTSGWAAKYELLQPIAEVTLKDGTVLHDVTFVSVGGASVTGKWAGGRGAIPLAMLPDAMRADLLAVVPAKPAPVEDPAVPRAPEPAADPAKLPTEIKLTNGFVMHQAKVAGWRADAMTVEYVGGKVLVKYDDVVPEQRTIFVAHKIELFAARARLEADRAAKAAGQAPGPAASGEPSPAELQALVKTGIATHLLVMGMTRQEVVAAIGMPDGVQYDPSKPEAAYWLFRGRGKGATGAPCDRILGFEKGILQGWKDQ